MIARLMYYIWIGMMSMGWKFPEFARTIWYRRVS